MASATQERSMRPLNDPSRRLQDHEIIVREAEESDMEQIAAIVLDRFPEEWWDRFESKETRRNNKIRAEKLGMRWERVWRHNSNFAFVVAEAEVTGEVIGVAGWHKPLRGQWNHNLWLADIPDSPSPHSWTVPEERRGDIEAKIRSAWADIDIDAYLDYWGVAEENRKVIEGDEPHWYLAPFAVKTTYEGRGVGSRLMRWGLDQADSATPRIPVYLEALDAARPIYDHYRFEERSGGSNRTIMIRR